MRRIEVVAYQPNWECDFISESKLLKEILSPLQPLIHHIGSTSVPGMAAKPIIDILIEVENVTDVDSYNDAMKKIGYDSKGEFGIEGRRYFQKGSDERTHHVHAFSKGEFNIARHIAFRDYLIAHQKVANEYAALKISVAQNCNNDIDRYCDGKNDFMQYHEKRAVAWYALNRVRAGFSPALPTPPRMRVRTGRFIAGFINRLDNETQSRVRALKRVLVL